MSNTGEDKGDFLFEEYARYKIEVHIGNTSAINMGDDLDNFVEMYNKIVNENITNTEHVVVGIFDYDKNTNIYYYNSDYEQ